MILFEINIMDNKNDTIFALSTPPGKSAIAVIRISGPNSIKIIKKISKNMPTKNRHSIKNNISINGETIDQTITTIFKRPNSYTGEDLVEVSFHGGQTIIEKITKYMFEKNKARLATPGEFTKRAFINNKLDLTQVEAVADLVNAETEEQRKQAINQLGGKLNEKTKKWSEKILKILANTEAIIDFTDEDLPNNILKENKEQTENIIKEITDFISDNKIGEKIRSGFTVSIVGRPNTGKSSFINVLAKRDLAIVTEEPGTTRDIIELFCDLDGLPFKFYDTAGITKSDNIVEIKGVKKSREIMKKADLNLVFINNISETKEYDEVKKKLFIQSKCDINKKIYSKSKIYHISSLKNSGIKRLIQDIKYYFIGNKKLSNASVSRERHRSVLKNTLKNLKKSKESKNYDLIAEDIRMAHNEISKITGNKDVEDILDVIFNDFCIGK
tara:strand:+ start:53 stop:1381 length:1329 start_codon:yes stop_codon:yes gene_type:complete